jgi:hypothetical protein
MTATVTPLEDLKIQISDILTAKLGTKFPFSVTIDSTCFGGKYIKIWWSCSLHQINNVRGQLPQVVSFSLNNDLTFKPQVYGGNGGRYIDRDINPENPKEKYLCMASEPIPFRTPKKETTAILKCLSKTIDNYIDILKTHKNNLKYQDIVDYNYLLS